MSESLEVVAETRSDEGKGASRRLRRQGLVQALSTAGIKSRR